MMRLIWLLFLLSMTAAAQNSIGVFAVGNFNPTQYAYLHGPQNTLDQPIVSSNKSAIGGGAEYTHWLSDKVGAGILYEQSPSDGKLWVSVADPNGKAYIWPQMRYLVDGLMTERFALGRPSLFLQEGAGALVTDGYKTSGWSHNLALSYGLGIDYPLSHRTSWRTALLATEEREGCYGDHTCTSRWGVAQDVRTGITWTW